MENIVFFDAKEYETKEFQNKLGDDFVLEFNNKPLLPGTKIDEPTKNTKILSVFTSSRLTEDVLNQFPNLQLIATRSVGYSHIDTNYCKNKGITVVNTPHYGDYTVAEFAFTILLNLVRKVFNAQEDLKAGIVDNQYFGVELFNKKIGIIGLGGIGSKALKIASGFSMEILAHDPYQNKDLKEKYDFEYTDVDYICENADIIALFAPSTPENYHLINAERISKMKKSVVIVNTARGELIDTQALYNALLDNKIAGAALDVLECEEALAKSCVYFKDDVCNDVKCIKNTLINHKLLTLPNVIVTPHAAYDTKEAVNRIIDMTVTSFKDFKNQNELKNKVV